MKMHRVAAIVGAAVITLAVTAVASAERPVHGSVEFEFPDMCTFPVLVHWDWTNITTANASISHAQVTISTLDRSRSVVDQQVVRMAVDANGDPVSTGLLGHIVLPGTGVVYAQAGRKLHDGSVLGRDDGYDAYAAAVCGALAG